MPGHPAGSTRSTSWPGTRTSRRLLPKGVARAPAQAGRRAGPRHTGEGQAADPRLDPARRPSGPAHAGQRSAGHGRTDHRGGSREGHRAAARDRGAERDGRDRAHAARPPSPPHSRARPHGPAESVRLHAPSSGRGGNWALEAGDRGQAARANRRVSRDRGGGSCLYAQPYVGSGTLTQCRAAWIQAFQVWAEATGAAAAV